MGWFQSGRTESPNINARFGKDLRAWWDHLQPQARQITKGIRLEDIPQEDWESVKIPGKQGIYLVLVGIAWWGIKLTKSNTPPESSPEWKEMVDDVRSVLEYWAKQPAVANSESRKRKQGNTAKRASKRRRK